MITGFKIKTIKTMTLGAKLRHARVRRNLTLIQAEEATKVRLRYLQAIESDDFSALPAPVYALGFLERYLDFLAVPKDKLIVEFKRSFAAWQSLQLAPLTPKQSVKEPKLIITPKLIFGTFSTLITTVMIGYIWVQVRHLTNPPALEIITPSQETKVALAKIEVVGKTDPGAVVQINSQRIEQDSAGNFKESISLSPGVNTIQVVAVNRFQKQSSKTIQILKVEEGDKEQDGSSPI